MKNLVAVTSKLQKFNAVLDKFYMDDYLDSFDNLDEAITTVHNVTPFLTFDSFNLATFISSNRITLKNLSREILFPKVANLDLEELLTYRVLVKTWDAV